MHYGFRGPLLSFACSRTYGNKISFFTKAVSSPPFREYEPESLIARQSQWSLQALATKLTYSLQISREWTL